jgi:hypothetical protein
MTSITGFRENLNMVNKHGSNVMKRKGQELSITWRPLAAIHSTEMQRLKTR